MKSAPIIPASGRRNLATEQRAAHETAPAARASAGAVQLAARMQLGERVFATVEDLFANGDALVRVQERNYRLALDRSVQPGNLVELELYSTKPAIRFSVIQAQAQASLSGTARLLNTLRTHTDAALLDTLAVEPLARNPADDAAVVAQDLQRVVDRSGLFYESHQVQWLEGKRPTSALLLEPQNSARPSAEGAVVNRTLANEHKDPHTALVNLERQGADTAASKQAHSLPVSLLRHQLDSLESGHVLMQLQVWDGQTMQWEITDYPCAPQGEDGDGALLPAWRTSITLDLPRLAQACARLCLDRSGIQLSLHAEAQSSADLMRREAPALARALEAAGLRVLGIAVHHDG